MGSYISVGFVFRNNKLNLKEKMFKYLVESLQLNDYSVLIYKMCTEMDGKESIEKKLLYRDITDKDYHIMTKYDYGNILLMCPFLGISNQMINIIFYKENTHFGFLIELFEDVFRKKIAYDKQEVLLVEFIKRCYHNMPFDYAICENEGQIEFSPDDIDAEDLNYSILILPDKEEGFIIKKGAYLIDGVTKREL
ncbi:hypothetical protein KHQ81_00475 [Mycoplasmatota bacterium]|nr:hypothetical protein KHQ81_00475 [Mycoplasmatota bacterium]